MQVLKASGVDEWQRICSETFVPLATSVEGEFTGQVEHVSLGQVGVSRVTCGPCGVARSARIISREPRRDLLINFVEQGQGQIRTDHHAAWLRSGQAALCEADSEYALMFDAPVTVLTLQFDRSMLPIADARIGRSHGRSIDNSPRLAILRNFMTGLLDLGQYNKETTEYGTIARDLLVLTLDSDRDASSVGEEDSLYYIVRAFMERHVTDPDLTVEGTARHHRISRRHLETLFARHGQSPAAFLRSLRLTRARNILESDDDSRISDIAQRTGFNDVATFRRAFRRDSGVPPDAWRRDHHSNGS